MKNIKQHPRAAGLIAAKEIITCIAEEAEAFRKKTLRQPSEEVYAKAYIIRLVEEMTALICDYYEDFMDNKDVCAVLGELTAYTGFLPAFIDWALEQEYVDIANLEKAAETLREFCKEFLRR